jgi:hypothetical protein
MTAFLTYKFYFESLWRDHGDNLPSMFNQNNESQNDKGNLCPEVLFSEVPMELPQPKQKKPPCRICPRIDRSTKKIRPPAINHPLMICFLPGCQSEFRPLNSLHKFCSIACKKECERRLYQMSKVASRILLGEMKKGG